MGPKEEKRKRANLPWRRRLDEPLWQDAHLLHCPWGSTLSPARAMNIHGEPRPREDEARVSSPQSKDRRVFGTRKMLSLLSLEEYDGWWCRRTRSTGTLQSPQRQLSAFGPDWMGSIQQSRWLECSRLMLRRRSLFYNGPFLLNDGSFFQIREFRAGEHDESNPSGLPMCRAEILHHDFTRDIPIFELFTVDYFSEKTIISWVIRTMTWHWSHRQ